MKESITTFRCDNCTWKIGDKHPVYGTVGAMGVREGEPYRMFVDKHGDVSLIPLECLK